MLDAEAEARRALTRLVHTCAECSEHQMVITAGIEAVKCSVKESLRFSDQQQTLQSSKVNATRYRLGEKDSFFQRELRMEVQMAELNTQMPNGKQFHTSLKPTKSHPNIHTYAQQH